FNNTKLLLHSEIGEPYDPESQTGVIGKNYCYQVFVEQTGFFEEEKFNLAMRSRGLYATFDDYNGDNFDNEDLDFIHGGAIILAQTAHRSFNRKQVSRATPKCG